jgi:tripartite-type tricarboxylate transporter receptor subunit TctC
MIVSNMPGGGGVVAANYAANVAVKDGTALLVPLKPIAMTQLLNLSVKYDASKFQWVGSMVDAPGALTVWHTAPVNTLGDAMQTQVALGSTGWGGETAIFPSVMNSVLGTKFNVVAGFKGMSNIFLGMERGELHGVSTVYGSVKGLKPEWLAQKKVRFIAQIAEKRIKELPDVPTVLEFAKTDEDRITLQFLMLSNVIGRSIAAPPGVPADRLAALRKAFDETVRSNDFLKETRDKGIDINPTPGQEVQKDVDRLFATPKATVEKVKAIVSTASSGKR